MKKTKRVLSIVVTFAILFSCIILPSNAYELLGGKLVGGIYNRTYYVGCGSSKYINACTAAMDDWNWAVNPYNNGSGTDFYFRRVYSSADATVRFWGESHPYDDWAGLTRLFDANDNLMNNDYSYLYSDWYNASIIFNTVKAPVDNATIMKSIAGHEVGHAIGLAHNQKDNGVLMFQGYNVRTADSPTDDDVYGVRALY